MLWSAPGTVLTCTQLDFSAASAVSFFFICPPEPLVCFHCLACSPRAWQVHWCVWLLDSFPRRRKLTWLSMHLFVCKMVFSDLIWVWKENSYPEGHWAEEVIPTEHLTVPQAALGGEQRQHCRQLNACGTDIAAAGAVLPQQDGGGSTGGSHSVVLCGWGGVRDKGHEWKAEQVSKLCPLQISFFSLWTVWFHVTWTPSTEWWQHNDLCQSVWLCLFKTRLVVENQ